MRARSAAPSGAAIVSKGGDTRLLAQPTFTPDSKRVAFKYLTQEKDSYPRVEAIVFFSPQGKELSRVPIPRIAPGTTRPASEVRGDK